MSSLECRWAFVGLSGIAQLFLKDLQLPRDASNPITHKLVAVSSTKPPSSAREWLKQNDANDIDSITIFQSYEDMLHVGTFDVVYISTPHSLHFPQARAAIQHGRNVLVEKPAVMNRKQYQRLAELAVKHGVVLMEAMWTRYFPLTNYLQEEILPQLGEIRRVIADWSVPLFDDPDLTPESRFYDKSTGAGALLDLGVYPLTWTDIALNSSKENVSSSPVEVVHASAIQHATPAGEDIDDINTVVLSRKEPPATSIATTSSSLPGSARTALLERLTRKRNAPSVRIQGTGGELAIPYPPIRPETCTVRYYGSEKAGQDGFDSEETITKEVYGWGLWYQADVLAKTLLERESGGQTRKQGLVIGLDGSLRVAGWVDDAKQLAGIIYNEELERVW